MIRIVQRHRTFATHFVLFHKSEERRRGREHLCFLFLCWSSKKYYPIESIVVLRGKKNFFTKEQQFLCVNIIFGIQSDSQMCSSLGSLSKKKHSDENRGNRHCRNNHRNNNVPCLNMMRRRSTKKVDKQQIFSIMKVLLSYPCVPDSARRSESCGLYTAIQSTYTLPAAESGGGVLDSFVSVCSR